MRLSVKIPREEYERLKRMSAQMGLPMAKVLIATIRFLHEKFEENPDEIGFELFKALRGSQTEARMNDKVKEREETKGAEIPEAESLIGKDVPEDLQESKESKEEGQITETDNVIEPAENLATQSRDSQSEQGKKFDPDEVYEMFLKRFRGGS